MSIVRGYIVGDEEVVTKMAHLSGRARRTITATVTRLTIKLSAKVKSDKLSGQVLKTVTGRLRRSINHRMKVSRGEITGSVGTNVEYAAVHEFGFSGEVNVRAHLREMRQAWGRPITPRQVMVQAHSRTANYPERSFLRSALKDMTPEVQKSFENEIYRAMQ